MCYLFERFHEAERLRNLPQGPQRKMAELEGESRPPEPGAPAWVMASSGRSLPLPVDRRQVRLPLGAVCPPPISSQAGLQLGSD